MTCRKVGWVCGVERQVSSISKLRMGLQNDGAPRVVKGFPCADAKTVAAGKDVTPELITSKDMGFNPQVVFGPWYWWEVAPGRLERSLKLPLGET